MGSQPQHSSTFAGSSLRELKWTRQAIADLKRLYEFLAPVNQPAAARAVQTLTAAPTGFLEHPRIGSRLQQFETREVRRIIVGKYEIRYEIKGSYIYVLRIFHTKVRR